MEVLHCQGVQDAYVNTIANIYKTSTALQKKTKQNNNNQEMDDTRRHNRANMLFSTPYFEDVFKPLEGLGVSKEPTIGRFLLSCSIMLQMNSKK